LNGKISAPAIGLMTLGCAGALASLPALTFGVLGPELLEPLFAALEQALRDALPEKLSEFQRVGSDGPSRMASGLSGSLFLGLNLFITWAGYRMLGRQSWTAAVVASVLAMLTCFAQCSCCPIGVAVGLWALAVLLSADVKQAFEDAAKT
jgi:hypothetical protein